jgi:replicative DNA helicase
MLGPLRIGDFGFLFARPESGKTTILASEVSFMANQTVRPIIWFNNEQPGEVVKSRIYQAYFGITAHELFSKRELYQSRYLEELSGRIKVYDSGSIHRRDVERVCTQFNPSLIVFDQIDKLKGFDNDRYDLEMKEIYQWARELSKKFGPVIGVCQAGGTAEGKKWLTMDDVDSSKTSKQGEADWILGIGKSNQEGMESVRHLHLCKNKLIGGELTIPELRHGKTEVLIKPEIARFEDFPERK